MKCLKIIIILAISTLGSNLLAADRFGFVWMTNSTSQGETFHDRLEVFPDGRVLWQTNSRGFLCPSQAGEYIGELSSEELKKLGLKVREVFEEQKKYASGRDSTTLLQVVDGPKVESTSVVKLTDKTKAFKEELKKLRFSLKSRRGVIMESEKDSKILTVTFKADGKDDYRFLLPDDPKEAFLDEHGNTFEYKVKPTRKDVVLGAKLDKVIVKFKMPKKVPRYIYFRNSSLLHHGTRTFKDPNLVELKEVNLCSKIESAKN